MVVYKETEELAEEATKLKRLALLGTRVLGPDIDRLRHDAERALEDASRCKLQALLRDVELLGLSYSSLGTRSEEALEEDTTRKSFARARVDFMANIEGMIANALSSECVCKNTE